MQTVARKSRCGFRRCSDWRRIQWLVAVKFRCYLSRAGILISDAFRTFDDDIIAWFPDAVVFNFGINEVVPRRIPRRVMLETANHDALLNQVTGRAHPVGGLVRRARRAGWLRVRWISESLVRLTGRSWRWLPLPRFLLVQKEMLALLFKETSAVAVVLGLNPCSQRVEAALPGSRQAILEANEAIRTLVATSPRAVFVNPREWIAAEEVERLVPDGIHYSAEGHRILAVQLRDRLGRFGLFAAS